VGGENTPAWWTRRASSSARHSCRSRGSHYSPPSSPVTANSLLTDTQGTRSSVHRSYRPLTLGQVGRLTTIEVDLLPSTLFPIHGGDGARDLCDANDPINDSRQPAPILFVSARPHRLSLLCWPLRTALDRICALFPCAISRCIPLSVGLDSNLRHEPLSSHLRFVIRS
jgi:hypothetical protein